MIHSNLPRSAVSLELLPSRSRSTLAAAVVLLLATTSPVAGTDPPAGVPAKVKATMESALRSAPELAARQARLAESLALVWSETGAGSPILTWQSEGIGGGFERNLNATDYLRLSKPFNQPWRVGTARSLKDASERSLESGTEATNLEIAALAGRRWLDLAAATELLQLAEVRLDRLQRALAIQTRRFELGEISGSERRQVALQHAREASALSQTQRWRFSMMRELEVLAPGGFPEPSPRDLEALVAATTQDDNSPQSELVLQSPVARYSESLAEVAALEADLQGGVAWGRPELEVEWERVPDLGIVEGFDSFGFRIGFPLPVGRQGRQRILAAERKAEAAEAELRLTQQRLRARYRAALESARSAEASLAALRPSLAEVEFTERSLTEQFRLGAISYLVYLDGFSRLDEVVQRAIETRHALLLARLELAEVSGSDAYFPLPVIESEDPS